ncbi:MAG: hypothetical protein JSU81_01865 [Candidatus Coatesbacteria bacterium]|nr:MAG: hypothetical protein JSU81_01865 [Candidatus Coatesbacteria bacterium]
MILRTVCAATLVAAALVGAQGMGHSTLVGGGLGVATYEMYAIVAGELQSSYKVGFHFGADFYRNDGRVTHLVNFDYVSAEDYLGFTPIKLFTFTYNLPIYLTAGRFRFAARPLFGARFATSGDGGSQGELGVLGGGRFAPAPEKCIFSDIYVGWRGRYGALTFERADRPDGWKHSFVFRNANTIEIVLPFCIYVTTAVDFDFSKVAGPPTPPGETGTRKPNFSGAFGPAFFF